MSDSPKDLNLAPEQSAAGPSPLPSARGSTAPEVHPGTDTRGDVHAGSSTGGKPTPARAMASPAPPSDSAEPDVDEVELYVDGAHWTVRLLGRSGATGSAPLVLLGFWPAGVTEGLPQREALTVGHALADFSEWGLERAFKASALTRPEGRTSTIFAETGERRRK